MTPPDATTPDPAPATYPGPAVSHYVVLIQTEQKLMILRPYEVFALQHMVKCIEDDAANGYVWHTTGSSKTLTSKATTLWRQNADGTLPA